MSVCLPVYLTVRPAVGGRLTAVVSTLARCRVRAQTEDRIGGHLLPLQGRQWRAQVDLQVRETRQRPERNRHDVLCALQ